MFPPGPGGTTPPASSETSSSSGGGYYSFSEAVRILCRLNMLRDLHGAPPLEWSSNLAKNVVSNSGVCAAAARGEFAGSPWVDDTAEESKAYRWTSRDWGVNFNLAEVGELVTYRNVSASKASKRDKVDLWRDAVRAVKSRARFCKKTVLPRICEGFARKPFCLHFFLLLFHRKLIQSVHRRLSWLNIFLGRQSSYIIALTSTFCKKKFQRWRTTRPVHHRWPTLQLLPLRAASTQTATLRLRPPAVRPAVRPRLPRPQRLIGRCTPQRPTSPSAGPTRSTTISLPPYPVLLPATGVNSHGLRSFGRAPNISAARRAGLPLCASSTRSSANSGGAVRGGRTVVEFPTRRSWNCLRQLCGRRC